MLLRDWQNCFFTTCSLIIYKSAGLIFAFHSVENILALLLFFGGKKIPELMKGLGGGIKEFKKASKEEGKEEEEKLEEKK